MAAQKMKKNMSSSRWFLAQGMYTRNNNRVTLEASIVRNKDAILKQLYKVLVFLCVMMVLWIGILPSSWLVGHSEWHRQFIEKHIFPTTDSLFSSRLVTKYEGNLAVQLTHILPGLLWSFILPLQFHSTIRKNYKRLHRILGYVFLCTVMSMTVGIWLISYRKLTFAYDYPELPPHENRILSLDTTIMVVSGWFLTTALMALWQIRIKNKYKRHQVYMIRHVGAGIWIAIQRVIQIFMLLGCPYTREQQRRNFGDSAAAAMMISVSMTEFAIWLLKQDKRQ